MTGETLHVHFLGTAGAMPSTARNPPCIMIRRGSDTLLFDCGEGAQQQMMRAKTGFVVDAIFITHWHADHFLGIFGLLQTLSFMGRVEPLEIFGPRGCSDFIVSLNQIGPLRPRFPIEGRDLSAGDRVEFGGYHVEALPAQHNTPCLGYLLREDARPGRFDRERAIELGVPPGPLFGRLQRGECVRIARGDAWIEIRPQDVLGPERPGRAIVYSGDTRPFFTHYGPAALEPDLLIHDATFDDGEIERAREAFHSTAGEAGQAAAYLQAKMLTLVHISSRYTTTGTHTRDARKYFPGDVRTPQDLTMLEIHFRDR
ncbi:MAG: ribonuclease Z [Methanomicrobiales archaeon]|nr:ribonuclease Z [Methanomicrobiales archaeon]